MLLNQGVENMKKYIPFFIILLLIIFILPSCNNNEQPDNMQDSVTETDELHSILNDTSISNVERTERISKIADYEINRAQQYKELIKEEYKERENTAIGYESFSFDSAYETLDEYCKYLENEFNNNIEFFKDFATVKYQSGSYASIWLSEKEYECAKNYADKMKALYEELR